MKSGPAGRMAGEKDAAPPSSFLRRMAGYRFPDGGHWCVDEPSSVPESECFHCDWDGWSRVEKAKMEEALSGLRKLCAPTGKPPAAVIFAADEAARGKR